MSIKLAIYLCGPYTKPDPVENTRNAILLGQRLRDEFGVITLTPHFLLAEHLISPRPYDYWLSVGVDMLSRCDALFRIEGESLGADLEEQYAKKMNMPVFHDEVTLSAWVEKTYESWRKEF